MAGTINKHDADELSTIKERLDMFLARGKEEYEEFDKWVLQEPRKSMGFIATKLKLGDPKSDTYKAIAEG